MAKERKPNSRVSGVSQADAVSADEGLQPTIAGLERLIMSRNLFERTLHGLATRSANWRESAAIWAGSLIGDESQVLKVYFHHELCDDKGGPLSLELTEEAKFTLYETLRRESLKLVGMIHTHPKDWVDLSLVDQGNQLCSRIGFWSLVVPWYARKPWELSSIGVHIRSDIGWYRLTPDEVIQHVIISGE